MDSPTVTSPVSLKVPNMMRGKERYEWNGRSILEAFGLAFAKIPDSEFELIMTLPAGWTTKYESPSDLGFSGHTIVFDDQHRRRAIVHRRSADDASSEAYVSVLQRFRLPDERLLIDRDHFCLVVLDADKEVFRTRPYFLSDHSAERSRAFWRAHKDRQDWLNEHHPNWENMTAAWLDELVVTAPT